jgi:hypothetical protein
MYLVMNEALAREHMRERQRQAGDARRARLAGELAAAARWRYLAERAESAARRRAGHAHRLVLEK